MNCTIYREFTLRNGQVWQSVVALIKGNAAAFAERGTPLRLILTTEEKKRNSEQNRFYWGCVLRDIAEQALVDGKKFDKDTWHEYFARKYGVCEDITLPDGEVIVRRKSTTKMTIGEFSEYLTKVQACAASEMGVQFE